jgi:hypothetical protein
MINKERFDRLAIILLGAPDTGKTNTLQEYCDFYHKPIDTFRKGWRHGLSPFKPKFWTIKTSVYILPASPTETNLPLSETIEPLDWEPDILLMAEQLNGKEYINTINYLRSLNYHIKEFRLSNASGSEIWDRWSSKADEQTKLLYRREEIADYIRNFIKSRI